MSFLVKLLMTGLLACCLHQASGADHRFRDLDELKSKFHPNLGRLHQCEPGSSSDDGCNTCMCSRSGFWICTTMACSWPRFPERFPSRSWRDVPIVENIPGAPKLVRAKRTPVSIGSTTVLVRNVAECSTRGDMGKPFSDGCKACRCVAANVAGCTTASCGNPEEATTTKAPEVTEVVTAVTHDTLEELGITTPTPKPETTTTPKTTLTPEPTETSVEYLERVTPIPPSVFCKTDRDIGMRYFDGCNRCRCSGVGRAACTKRGCQVIRRVTPTPAAKVCAAETDIGKRYFDGCNWCRCFSVGNAACTYRACPVIRPTRSQRTTRSTTPSRVARPRRVRPRPASEVCLTQADIGKSYYDGCNWCRCMQIGRAGCTRRMCPFMKDRRTTKATAAPTTPAPTGFCSSWRDVGRQQYDGCNHCMCSTGLRKICTMRHCFPAKVRQ
ncbi:uncharacterized protein LOC135482888 [Lineus longissimus]|uniref:uncharacterized protein LOC135482888 n=1 Tax=Lineus longissimus TaxID=88925 RepID=UPI00315CC943